MARALKEIYLSEEALGMVRAELQVRGILALLEIARLKGDP